MMRQLVVCGWLVTCANQIAPAQETAEATPAVDAPATGWRAHDLQRPRPAIIRPAGISAPVAAPSDAVVLFDGTDLTHWQSGNGEAARWVIEEDYMESVPGSGPLRTTQGFGDIQLHAEWAAPTPAQGSGQGRGNSGIYLMGKYEVQVLDSYGNDTYPDGQAASIYGQRPPLVNACLPPGEWQTYDLVFRRPRFGGDGGLLTPANITLFHNGVLVQDHVPLWGPTNWLKHDEYAPHADQLPMMLQDHGNPVRYRNIWLRELPPPIPDPGRLGSAKATASLSTEQLDRLVGRYQQQGGTVYPVRRQRDQLQVGLQGRFFDLVPQTETRFAFKHTAATAEFELPEGQPPIVTIDLMGSRQRARRVE